MSLIAEAAIAKRLDQIDRRIARLAPDVGISVETIALFIRFWLTTTPPLPEPVAKTARAQAGACYDNFVAALGRWQEIRRIFSSLARFRVTSHAS